MPDDNDSVSVQTLETETNKSTKVIARDMLFEKFMGRTSSVHEKLIRALMKEVNKILRPYLWLVIGIYLSFILPLIIMIMIIFITCRLNGGTTSIM